MHKELVVIATYLAMLTSFLYFILLITPLAIKKKSVTQRVALKSFYQNRLYKVHSW